MLPAQLIPLLSSMQVNGCAVSSFSRIVNALCIIIIHFLVHTIESHALFLLKCLERVGTSVLSCMLKVHLCLVSLHVRLSSDLVKPCILTHRGTNYLLESIAFFAPSWDRMSLSTNKELS